MMRSSSALIARLVKPLAIVSGVAALVVGFVYFLPKREAPKGSYGVGRMVVGEEIVHEFIIPNPYPEGLMVSSVRPSHPDSKVAFFETLIPGHGKGLVRVVVRPSEPGPLQISFSLDYGSDRKGLGKVALHGEVAPPELPKRVLAPDPKVTVSAQELLGTTSLKDSSLPVVVDLRSPDDFRRSHLPQSLNMRSSQLKASHHLKGKTLVLVDEGAVSTPTLELASQLQASGFTSVRILDGGVPAWQALGAETVGSERGLPSMISPLAFLEVLPGEGWRVLDARTSGKPLPFAIPSSVVKMSSLSGDGDVKKFRQGMADSERLVILTDTGDGREQLRDFAAKMAGVPLFFVRDGAAGINREYLRISLASSVPVAARVDGTATASNKRVTRSLGGCSTCP